MIQAVASGWSNWSDFSGRVSRSEYWYWHLSIWLIFIAVCLVVQLIALVNGHLNETARYAAIGFMVFLAVCVLPGLSLQVRRLHDIGATGWVFLLALIPLAGAPILVILALLPGTQGENRYGPESGCEPEPQYEPTFS